MRDGAIYRNDWAFRVSLYGTVPGMIFRLPSLRVPLLASSEGDDFDFMCGYT